MQIQVNTDNVIHGDERVIEVARTAVHTDLSHLEDRLTRVEVHLNNQSHDKQGPDQYRCTIEARPKGLSPMSAHHDAADIPAALKGAAKKLRERLGADFAKRDPHR